MAPARAQNIRTRTNTKRKKGTATCPDCASNIPGARRPPPTPSTPHTGWHTSRQAQTPAIRQARQARKHPKQRHARGRTQANEGRPQLYRPQEYAPPTPPVSCLLPPVYNRVSWCAHVRVLTWLHARAGEEVRASIAERVRASAMNVHARKYACTPLLQQSHAHLDDFAQRWDKAGREQDITKRHVAQRQLLRRLLHA